MAAPYQDIKIPYIQIRNNSAILYQQSESPRRYTDDGYHFDATAMNIKNFEGKPAFSGAVTEGAKKRLARAISLLVQSTPERWMINPVTKTRQKFKLNFITLTVSDTDRLLTAQEAHRMLLEPMLKHFRDVHGMKSYVWKAELQKRGQIHYHITTDIFIHYEALRYKWNKLQKKNGLLERYHEKYGHYNPNSTDVHSVYKMRNIEAYLVKYLSKNGGRDKAADAWIKRYSERRVYQTDQGFEYTELPPSYFNHVQITYTKGKIWACSENLKHSKYFTALSDN